MAVLESYEVKMKKVNCRTVEQCIFCKYWLGTVPKTNYQTGGEKMGQMAICPKCKNIMSTNVMNTSPISRKCKCGETVQWYLDKKTGRVQTGLRR